MVDDWYVSMVQLCDSMFPAGVFAMSNGIESMQQAGQIKSATDLENLNAMYIQQQVGPADCVAAVASYDCALNIDMDGILRLDHTLMAQRLVQEPREASGRSGAQMCRCVAEFLGSESVPSRYLKEVQMKRASGAYPVAFGICCQSLDIPRERVPLMLLYGFVAGNMGAALRLGIINHYESQCIIHKLKPIIVQAAQRSCTAGMIWQFCPQAEIIQMSHENLDSKMFIT